MAQHVRWAINYPGLQAKAKRWFNHYGRFAVTTEMKRKLSPMTKVAEPDPKRQSLQSALRRRKERRGKRNRSKQIL